MTATVQTTMSEKTETPKITASIGGTFDALHEGHKEYIQMAFTYANYVFIYVTSDEYAQFTKTYFVRTYDCRVERLKDFIAENGIGESRYEIKKLPSLRHLKKELLSKKIDISIVTPEYQDIFEDVNQLRQIYGKKKISVLLKQRTRDHKNTDLSSTILRFPTEIFQYIPRATAERILTGQIKTQNKVNNHALKKVDSCLTDENMRQERTDNHHRVFLSYADENKEIAYRVYDVLASEGIEVFAAFNIEYGVSIPLAIETALKWSNTLVLLWSQHASQSRFVQDEWSTAYYTNQKIIGCLLEPVELPCILKNRRYIEFANLEQGITQLLDALIMKPIK